MVLCGCLIYLCLLLLVLNKRGYAKSNLRIMCYNYKQFLVFGKFGLSSGSFQSGLWSATCTVPLFVLLFLDLSLNSSE